MGRRDSVRKEGGSNNVSSCILLKFIIPYVYVNKQSFIIIFIIYYLTYRPLVGYMTRNSITILILPWHRGLAWQLRYHLRSIDKV